MQTVRSVDGYYLSINNV